jgi:HTH-like domain
MSLGYCAGRSAFPQNAGYKPTLTVGALTRRIDELHLKWPFYGSRRMVFELNQAGHGVNRKRVQRLNREPVDLGLTAKPRRRRSSPMRSRSIISKDSPNLLSSSSFH